MRNFNFKDRVEKTCSEYDMKVEWQIFGFGYRRARIRCKSLAELDETRRIAERIRGAEVDIWIVTAGVFEGYVYIMERTEYQLMKIALQRCTDQTTNWWQRYRMATPETQDLISCGAVK